MKKRGISIKAIRYLGFGAMVAIIAVLSLAMWMGTQRFDVELQKSMGSRQHVQEVDALLAAFVEIRGQLTQFLLEDQTDLLPLVGQVKSLQDNTEALMERFPEGEGRRLIERFIGEIKKYRASMAAYAYEVSLRNTGDGARTWEKKLMDIEREAHGLTLSLKQRFREDSNERERNLAGLARKGRAISMAFGIGGLLSALLVAVLLQQALKRPIEDLVEVTEAIAEGDLTQRVQGDSRDELGILTGAIARMMGSLQRIVRQIQKTTSEIENSAVRLGGLAGEVFSGVNSQEQEIVTANALIARLNSIVDQVMEQVQGLTENLDRSSSSTEEISATIAETSALTDRLAMEVDQISSALSQMNANSHEILNFLDSLGETSLDMRACAENLAGSSEQVGENGREATRMARAVKEMAEVRGLAALGEMERVTGMNRAQVENYREFIAGLDKKSREIGQIVHVISEIAEQTNLLSLNASIIAAQAGVHGRGFAVVADEVRNLSVATSSNLKDISGEIGDIQREVEQAVEMVEKLLDGADSSTATARSVGEILKEIVDCSNLSLEKAAHIESAAQSQQGLSHIIKSKATSNSEQVFKAQKMMAEQKKGVGQILSSSESLRDVAFSLKQSTREQAGAITLISGSMIDLHHLSQDVSQAMNSEQDLAGVMAISLERIGQVAKTNLVATEDLEASVKALRALSLRLHPEVAHFKLLPEGVEPV